MESINRDYPLAIICPVVNCLEYTKQFIESIKTKLKYKIIIIDNASTDGTTGYLISISKKYPIRVIKSSYNMGVSAAWNLGIRTAIEEYHSNYFLIPNNDIILYSKTIDTLINTIQKKDVVLATSFNINTGDGLPRNVDDTNTLIKEKITEEPDFSCFMIKKETIEKIGYFDERYYPAYFEDNDYHYRIKVAGLKAVKTTNSVYFHFGSMTIKNNETTRALSNNFYLNNKEYYKNKWGGYPGQEKNKYPANL